MGRRWAQMGIDTKRNPVVRTRARFWSGGMARSWAIYKTKWRESGRESALQNEIGLRWARIETDTKRNPVLRTRERFWHGGMARSWAIYKTKWREIGRGSVLQNEIGRRGAQMGIGTKRNPVLRTRARFWSGGIEKTGAELERSGAVYKTKWREIRREPALQNEMGRRRTQTEIDTRRNPVLRTRAWSWAGEIEKRWAELGLGRAVYKTKWREIRREPALQNEMGRRSAQMETDTKRNPVLRTRERLCSGAIEKTWAELGRGGFSAV